MALFLVTLIASNSFLEPSKALRWNMLGYDFRTWYIAGTLAREGRSVEFYDLKSIERFDRQLARDHGLDLDQGIGPIFNPPFFAWIFAPLTRWSYPTALKIWYAFSAGCLVLSAFMMSRMLCGVTTGAIPSAKADPTGNKATALILILLATSMPAVQALVHAQNTFLSLLMLTCVVTCWRSGHAFGAGLLAGFLFYKPQLGAVVAVGLIVTMGWRAVIGLVITGVLLILLNVLTLPGSLTDFFVKMPANLRWLQEEHIYAWKRHATFQGFWRTLLQWGEAGPVKGLVRFLSTGCMVATAVGVGRLLWRFRKGMGTQITFDFERHWGGQPKTPHPNPPPGVPGGGNLGLVIASTLIAMPLLMPFYFDYDLLLLGIAAVLTAADFLHQGRELKFFADRWLPTAWVGFYICMYLNLPMARLTHISPLVPSLVFLTSLTLSRATRQLENPEFEVPLSIPDDMIVTQCAA